MNKLIYTLLLATTLIVPVGYGQQRQVLDRVVAVVGKEPILFSDLNSQVEFYALNNRIDPSTPGLKDQVLEAMVNEKLILAKALEDTLISINEEDVTAQLEALIAQRVEQVGSEKKLEDLYGMPISRMKREFRDETRKQLMVQQLQQMRFGSIQPSRREVDEFYQHYKDSLPKVPEEVEVYHIYRVPKIGESVRSEIRARAQRVLDSLKAGEDFTVFARRYSEDLGTAPSGGDLGFVRRGEFFKEFEEAAFSLKDSALSGIVETPLGFHIIQLVERRGEQVHPRHILFKFKEDITQADSTIAFLKGLKDSLGRGASFSEMAKRFSEDKETAQLGGYLGRLPVTQFEKSMLETLKNLKDGEISDPIEVKSGRTTGYQIVYLKRRLPEHIMTPVDDWKRLEQLATSFKRTTEYQKWLKQLRGEIYWDIRLEKES